LQSVQECAGTGECFAPTRFYYGKSETVFENIATNIASPLSDKASPMFFDIDGDGLSDYVVGDSTPASTAEHLMAECFR
ncbi:MAG TPA: VCBS repeat-containing protein, partial [Polyangium sp.]|nr:VCBS repeat-containing protein [Polyangium sp.]